MKNTHVDVKNSATAVLCALYRQLGDTVREMVSSSELGDLLKKAVLESLDKEK